MSERNKTHNGRGVDGHFKVRRADVEDLQTDPNGALQLPNDMNRYEPQLALESLQQVRVGLLELER